MRLCLCFALSVGAVLGQLELYGVADITSVRGSTSSSGKVLWKSKPLLANAPPPSWVEFQLWDGSAAEAGLPSSSGKVAAAALSALAFSYAKDLPIGVYTYALRLWDEAGNSTPYSSAKWIVAPAATDFTARWICGLGTLPDTRTTVMSANFSMPALSITSALLSVAGLGQSSIQLNGVSVDSAVAPAWSNWRNRTLFNTYDVKALLSSTHTINSITATLGNGMYNVALPPGGRYTKFTGSFGPRMLLLQLDITFSDGSTQRVQSDGGPSSGWRATEDGPITFTHVYAGEDHDLSRSAYPSAPVADCTAQYPGGALAPAVHPPPRVTRTLQPVGQPTCPTMGTIQFDLGINFSGFPVLVLNTSTIAGPVIVTLTPGEARSSAGAIDQSSSGEPMFWRVTVMPPAGRNPVVTFAPLFSTYGWRWLELTGVNVAGFPADPSHPTLISVSGNVVHADVKTVGNWSSSSAALNAIQTLTVEAMLSNMQHTLTDCPHRERLGWLETTHLLFPSLAFNFDIALLWAKISRDTIDSQTPNGMVPSISPEWTVFSGGFRDSPEWGVASVLNPSFLATWYGDLDTLNATYETGKAYVEYLASRVSADTGLITYGLGDWLDVCGTGQGACTPSGVTATATFIQGLDAMASAGARLGHAGDAARFMSMASEARAAYNRSFWQAGLGTFGSQTANAMAVVNGIALDPGVVSAALSALVANVTAGYKGTPNVTMSGDIGNRYTWMALGAAGPPAAAVVAGTLTRSSCPGYGCMVAGGETALSESWFDAPGESHNHAMLGHISEFFYRFLAGIQPDHAVEPPAGCGSGSEWCAVHISPMALPGLSWVSAAFDSPAGMIRSAWRVDDASGAFFLDVEIPPTVQGRATLPSGRVVTLHSGTQRLMDRDDATS